MYTVIAIAFAVLMSQVYVALLPFVAAIICCIATGVMAGVIGAELDMNR